VHVAEAHRADGHAVLEEQEGAAGAGSAEHRGTYGSEALLATVALDHGARRAIEDLAVMRRADQPHLVDADPRDAAGILAQGLALPGGGDDDLRQGFGCKDCRG